MRAVRRLTAPRARTNAMTAKATVPVARNTSSASIRLLLSRNVLLMNSASIASDLEVDELVHDEVADTHPAAGEHQANLGELLIPDADVEVRRNEVDHGKHADRQRRQNEG